MKENELKALVSLIDDDDLEVSSHVENKLISMGSDVIPLLEEVWEKSFNSEGQRRIEDIIHTLQFDQLKKRFAQWKEQGSKDILEGMWLLSTYQYPDLELKSLQKQIDQMYYEVWSQFRNNLNAIDQIKILNDVFFERFKFRANTKNFHSPANSMINMVIESKRGNPITMCVLYMLIARKLKMPISGVNMPNLFILTYKQNELQFYINVFNKGMIFSKEDVENYLNHLKIPHDEKFFQPCDNLDIVKRGMRNLIISFEKLGEHEKSDEVKSLLYEIADMDEA